MSDPSRPDEPKPIGDAHSLFPTDELPVTPRPSASVGTPSTEGYDLEGGPIADDDTLPEPVPIPIPTRPANRPKPPARPKLEFERADPEGSSEFESEVSEVDPVWTRWAEWGPDLTRIGAVGLGTLFLAWLLSGNLMTAFLVFLLGLAVMVVLSYPILVTLERPVRITPEQAVTDFFAAASHHLPHFRRMWLLLSVQGRDSGRFQSFEQFRDQWQSRISGWRQSKGVGKYAPLKFEVEGFRADKSTGKETSKADYTVLVYLRDREVDGPIETFKMVHGLVKGPDKMWYLNRGTLENRSR